MSVRQHEKKKPNQQFVCASQNSDWLTLPKAAFRQRKQRQGLSPVVLTTAEDDIMRQLLTAAANRQNYQQTTSDLSGFIQIQSSVLICQEKEPDYRPCCILAFLFHSRVSPVLACR